MDNGIENIGASGAVCWACGAAVPGGNNYCGKCGQGQGGYVSWYYKHPGAVFLTLAAGPLALYFIWRSPVLSSAAKWAYTAAVAVLTWYAIGVIMAFFEFLPSMMSASQI